MNLLPIRKILRFALAVSVSLWMAGAGCLLGCSNETRSSPATSVESTDTVVAESSCESSSSHDCCAKKKAHHQSTARNNTRTDLSASQVRPTQSMMESCPMAVTASAIVSKGRAQTSKASITKTVEAPLPSTTRAFNSRTVDRLSLYNRGPTYLRCCSFLI
jgi:hypothetical protein